MTERLDLAALTPAERRALLADLLRKQGGGQARPVTLSFAEQRLWFLEQLDPANPVYNIGVAGQIDGPLDVEALVAAFDAVVRRHDVLRSTYRLLEGRPVKAILPELSVAVAVEDMGDVPVATWDAELARIATAEAQRPFDLEHGPLLRVRLLRRTSETHVVLATVHHIVFDGWSTLVLLGEVAALYGAFVSGQPSPLPPLPVQYADFARWQRQWLRGAVLEEQVSYWKERLAGELPTVDLPTVRPRPRIQRHRGARERVALSPALATALRDLSRGAGVTLFMTLLAGFDLLLRHHTGLEDVIVGTDTAGRNRAETEHLIGFFVNELVLRNDLSGDPTCRELLGRVREVCLGAYAHQDLPFERLLRVLRPDRTRGRAPLFQMKLVLQNDWLPTVETSGITWRLLEIDGQTAKAELFVSLVDRGDTLAGFVEYDTDLFDAPAVRDWFHQLEVVLAAMAADPDARLSALDRRLAAADADARQEALRRHRVVSHARLRAAVRRAVEVPAEVAAEGSAASPLSPTQECLWRLGEREAHPYVALCTAVIRGPVRASQIAGAIERAVARHDALRTTFPTMPGQPLPVQLVTPAARPAIEIDEFCTGAGACERALEAARLRLRERGGDLVRGPVVHATIIPCGPDRHLLLLGMPALCADAASLDVLAREVLAGCAGTTVPEPVRQYPDVAEWQWDELGDAAAPAAPRWGETGDGPTLLERLPLERRADGGPYDPEAVRLQFTPGIAAEVAALAARCDATPSAVLLACWQVLMWRLSGRAEFVVGLRTDGRRFGELATTVGPFERRVPVPGALAESMRLVDVIAAARDGVAVAVEAQERVAPSGVQGDGPAASGAQAAVGFAYDDAPRRFTAGAVSLEIVAREACVERIPLGLSCAADGNELAVTVEYDASTFAGDDMARMAARFVQLVRSALAAPEAPIGDLELVGPEERRHLLTHLNDTAVEWPREGCLHELVEAQVARTPDACAVVAESGRLTYAELDARANRLAHHLGLLGVGPDVLVGICAERSLELVVGLLGILKAGAAYLPLDPGYPRDRLAFMLADARPPVILTQQALVPLLPASAARIVCLDADWDVVARAPDTKPAVDVVPDHLAYVIYTSGSTGRPKGAMNDHRGIHNRLLWMQQAYGLEPDDAVLQKTPFSFDVSVWEFFWPLMAGARLVLARPGGHGDPTYLADLIVRERITTAHFVPSMLRVFLEDTQATACTSLRRVISSGEALPPDLQERFFTRLRAELHNLYGPTEAAVDVTAWACRPGSGSVPIGRPIANTAAYVLDPRLRPLPLGVPGELYIGGVQVGRGYVDRPALTAQRFVPDPFSGRPGARLYRTGDLVRHRRDGALEFLGRLDHQVKIRGHRIELGEIEAALLRHPDVREAVVHVHDGAAGEPRLVAYVVPADGADPSSRTLRAALEVELPEAMVPRAFVRLTAMPLGPNGKVDRRALPEPDREAGRPPHVAPRDALEAALAALWEECLDVRPVGVDDDFFDLGGHSLLAVRLLARIRGELGRTLPLSSLFEATTVGTQAALLRAPTPAAGSTIVAIQPHGSRPPFFCVHPAGGHVLCYVPLARALGPTRPFYGLEARGLDGVTAPHSDVPGMASAYVAAVRGRQPAGPYLLGGSSFGGVVAFEMAQQLRRAGEEVALLALLDTLAPLPGNLPGDIDPARRLRSVVGTITRFMGQTLAVPIDELSRLGIEEQIDQLLAAALRENVLPAGCDRALIDRIVGIHKLNFVALERYAPQVYPGRLVVFRAAEISPDTLEPPGAREDPALGWGELSPHPIELIPVPGDHMTMLAGRHVAVLADELRRCLEHATGGTTHG